MPLPAGTRLGSYEIVSALGAGGMGEVYRAHDTRLGRDVALKVLPGDVTSSPDRLARFEREARTVASLNHPNIVVLHSIEEVADTHFLTMELVEGQTLDRHVTPGGLPIARVLELGIAVSDALTAAHEKGVVHRDLKPANVMLTREGRVKVLDFGLAKPPSEASLEATQAMTAAAPISTAGQVVGTVPYMSPEQIRGAFVDARTDLFAFGILLYELAAGRRPFEGASSAEVSSSILRDAPPPVHILRSDLPQDLGRIIARCLEKDPERRVQTAKDVRNELELLRREFESSAPSAARARSTDRSPDREVPSIAVLPFANRSRDEEDEYFADGLADELLNVLTKIRGLRVAARTSSFQFKGKNEDLAVIGQKLNVATLLEGSVRKAGSRVRIMVQLVKVADGFHLWSESYDRTLDDIFAVQDDIAQSVVKELRTTLLGEASDSKASGDAKADVAVAAAGRGVDPEAHQHFIQGRLLLLRADQPEVERGIENLKRAIEIDPNHARAWATLSWADTLRGVTGMAPLEEAITRARQAAHRALQLEPGLAEGHLALASIQHWYDFDWKRALASFERAIEAAPSNAEILSSAGLLSNNLRRFEEALARCQRAVELDPLSAVAHSYIGRIHYTANRLREADVAFGRMLELAPGFAAGHLLVAMIRMAQGRLDDALAEALQEKAPWYRLQGLAIVRHARGEANESDAAVRELVEKHSGHSAWQIATAHAARGEADATFEWLERCYAQHDSGLALVQVIPFFHWLRADPRWDAFMRKIGLAEATSSATAVGES